MPDIHPVSKSRHGNQRWKRYASYAFASGDVVALLVAAELPKACMSFPVGFLESEQDGFVPVGVLGIDPGSNLFVTRDGRWLAGYIPAIYRSYPFSLGKTAQQEQLLCVDEDSGLVEPVSKDGKADDSNTELEAFFNDQDQPTTAVSAILDFLVKTEKNRQATRLAVKALTDASLIVPWEITIKSAGGSDKKIEGLYRIDEARFNALPSQSFDELRRLGAIAISFCQMLSMQHINLLAQLMQAHKKANAPKPPRTLATPTGEIDFSFLDDETIGFGASKPRP